jgi:hypothetical protein
MATATFKFNISPILGGFGDAGERTITYYGNITFSAAADTYPTGGMLPLAGFALKNLGPYADRTPLFNYVSSTNGASWFYLWNQTTGKLMIFASAAGSGTTSQAELTNGTALNVASPNIFTDIVLFNCTFPRGAGG